MKLVVALSFAVVLTVAQARAFAGTPAPVANQAPAASQAAPAAETAAKAAPSANWYYIPSGWYLLVPAGQTAATSAVPAAPKGSFPGPVAMPAGIPAAAGTYPVIVIQQPAPAVAQPSMNYTSPASSSSMDSFYSE